MSALEFISSIKWPVTVLLLAAMATALLKRNPDTRTAMGAWFGRRNLRLNLAGQEFEATIAETQGSMDLAAGNDRELAETVTEAEAPAEDHQARSDEPTPEALELARRTAVENVARNGVRLGWQWGQDRSVAPKVSVWWTDAGHPTLHLSEPSASGSEGNVRDLLTMPVPHGVSEGEFRAAMKMLMSALATQSRETVGQQTLMREAVWQRIRRNRDSGGEEGVRLGETNTG